MHHLQVAFKLSDDEPAAEMFVSGSRIIGPYDFPPGWKRDGHHPGPEQYATELNVRDNTREVHLIRKDPKGSDIGMQKWVWSQTLAQTVAPFRSAAEIQASRAIKLLGLIPVFRKLGFVTDVCWLVMNMLWDYPTGSRLAEGPFLIDDVETAGVKNVTVRFGVQQGPGKRRCIDPQCENKY